MKKKITLKQIAKELGFSVSTVSKALRNSPEISEDTKSKVQAFAQLYNYRPNNIALSLKSNRSKKIGVIIPEIVHYFFSNVIRGIEKVANEKGYNVVIALSNESFDKEVLNMQMLADGSIDGCIISVSKETMLVSDYHHLNETINQGIPIVMFDREISNIACDRVIIDDKRAAKNAVLRLLDGGCQTIGLITTPDYLTVGRLRTDGFREALQERNVQINEEHILKLDYAIDQDDHIAHLKDKVSVFLENNPEIDAILAVNELFALTAMKASREFHRSIPGDLQIIAFTDGVLSRHATPTLTTVKQHGQVMGEKAAELLIKRLENLEDDENYETVIINTSIVERESTKPLTAVF